MKTTLKTLLCAFLIFTIGLKAQNTKQKVRVHKVWITLVDGTKMKGSLFSADKLGLKITNKNSFDVANLISIEARKIDNIKIRRKGQIGRGVWIGVLAGAATGVLIGFVSGDDEPGIMSFTKESKAIGLGIAFGVLGTGVGALTATAKKKIIINGDTMNYERHLETIQSYSLQPITQ